MEKFEDRELSNQTPGKVGEVRENRKKVLKKKFLTESNIVTHVHIYTQLANSETTLQ